MMLELVHRTSSVKSPIELARASIPSASEKELGVLERHAETAAFDRLITGHRDVCMKWAWLIMHNESEAQDAVQNAFRKAFQCRDQFKNSGTFAAWLHRIVKNECLMRLRKEKKRVFCLPRQPDRIKHSAGAGWFGYESGRPVWPARSRERAAQRDVAHAAPLSKCHDALRQGAAVDASCGKAARSFGPGREVQATACQERVVLPAWKACGRKGPGTLLENAVYSRTAS